MARPGEVREVLRCDFAGNGPATWREAAVRAGVGYAVACHTVKNMVRAGELVECGREKPAGSRVWRVVYELVGCDASAEGPVQAWGGIEDMAAVMQVWPVDRPP
jgi:hypothetical protein